MRCGRPGDRQRSCRAPGPRRRARMWPTRSRAGPAGGSGVLSQIARSARRRSSPGTGISMSRRAARSSATASSLMTAGAAAARTADMPEPPIRAAYRNRTDDLRITRGPIPGRMHAMSTDTTDHRADGTRLAGTIQGSVPRAVPRPRPCVAPSCSLCVTSLRALPHAPMSMSRRNGATGYRPLPHAGLPACGCRSNQLATFFNGIAGDGPGWPPGPPVAREDIETAFARASAPARAWDGRRRSGSLLTVGACGQAMLQGRLPVRDSRLSSRPAPSRRTGCFPARRAVRDGPRRPR